MKSIALLALLLFPILGSLSGGCAHARFDPVNATGFSYIDGSEGRYFAFIPKDAAERARRGEKLPVILFLHGADERGTDASLPTQVGLGPVVEASHGAFPFIVLFPQCPKGHFWPEPVQQQRLVRLLADALPKVGGDPDRVYLTGNSMGGYGTWLLGAEHPELFAAIVPICGGVKPPRGYPIPPESRFGRSNDPYADVAKALGQMPVWAFHGAKDWLVSPTETRSLVAALRANGNTAKHTEYPDVGHQSWVNAYAESSLFTWLAAQRVSARSTATDAGSKAVPAPGGI